MNKKSSPQVGLIPTPHGEPSAAPRRSTRVRARQITAVSAGVSEGISAGVSNLQPAGLVSIEAVALAERYLGAVEMLPTETQQTLFHALSLDSRDVLLVGPTGSGKTFAAALPLMASVLSHPKFEPGVKIVIVAPTRALVDQHSATCAHIAIGLTKLAQKDFVLSVAARTGDTTQHERKKHLTHPPDVLVVTPESLQILLSTDARSLLLTTEFVVLDEVHQLCAERRGALLSPLLSLLDWQLRRAKETRPRPRRIALTATAHPEQQIARWVSGESLNGAAKVCSTQSKRVSAIELIVPDAEQFFPEPGHNARKLLPMLARKIAQNPGTSVFFVSSRVRAEAWTQALRDVLPASMLVRCFHSSMSKDERALVAQQLHRGELRAVVATSALEAGVDIASAEQVLFLGAPRTVTQTLQSTGRSRHRPGESGVATIACTDISDALDALAIKQCAENAEIEAVELQRGDEAILVQAVLALVASGPMDVSAMAGILKSSYAFATLQDHTLAEVIDHLRTGGEALSAYDATHRIAGTEQGYVFASATALRTYLRAVGTIVDNPSYTVVYGQRTIGKVDGRFAAGLEIGGRFTLSGSTWKVVQLLEAQINVARDDHRGPIAEWNGARGVQSPLVTQRLAALYQELATHVEARADAPALAVQLGCAPLLAQALIDWGTAQERESVIPTEKNQLVERIKGRSSDSLVVYTFAGTNTNDAIARVAAERWKLITHAGCEFAASEVGLVLTLPHRKALDTSRWASVCQLFIPLEFGAYLQKTLDGSALARSVFRDVARVAQLSTADNRPGGASPNLLYDVLRKHAPSHLLMHSLNRALWAVLQGDKAVEVLERLQGKVTFKQCSRVSAMAIPLVARAQRRADRVAPDDLDSALSQVAHELWIRSGAIEMP